MSIQTIIDTSFFPFLNIWFDTAFVHTTSQTFINIAKVFLIKGLDTHSFNLQHRTHILFLFLFCISETWPDKFGN